MSRRTFWTKHLFFEKLLIVHYLKHFFEKSPSKNVMINIICVGTTKQTKTPARKWADDNNFEVWSAAINWKELHSGEKETSDVLIGMFWKGGRLPPAYFEPSHFCEEGL